MHYVLDPTHQPHGIVVHQTDDAHEADRVADDYERQNGRPVVVAEGPAPWPTASLNDRRPGPHAA